MTKAEYAQRHAIQARYGERVRWEERQRAYDIIELRIPDDNEAAAELLWTVAAEIMRHKP